MIQLIWNKLAYQGVLFVDNIAEHKHIILVNTLALFIPVFILFTILSNYFMGIPSIFYYTALSYILLLPFCVYLNAIGKVSFSRLYLTFLSFAYLFAISVIEGSQVRGHFFLLTEALVVFFIFPSYQKRRMYLIITFLFIVFAGFVFIHDSLPPLIVFPEGHLKKQNISSDISFASLLLIFSYYIYNTFQKTELYVQLEHDKSEKLLQNILPISIIKKLRENPDTIAERFEDCTVLFSDIVGFTQMSRNMSAVSLVSLLNEVFSKFDDLAEKYKLEKIKTIGDAYMVVGGLPEPDYHHVERVASFALEMLDVIKEVRQKNNVLLELRIGINSGHAVAGVIGKKKFIYDLWGDSVNTASRMESHGLPGQIQVSESTYSRLKDQFQFEDRGKMEVKGLGITQSYFLIARLEI
jgi:class 3 adenylate cyclase